MTIQCTEITSIRKEKTALVIPNAIQVCTESEKVCYEVAFVCSECCNLVESYLGLTKNSVLFSILSTSLHHSYQETQPTQFFLGFGKMPF